ncbi:hypothetical protein K458DRAFT_38460 [Lentithecium fluviatile CBS 122367]|uniref:Uncharacterized protein n=1 Tax=Lentithecium fluviatile CBS 122367 TaxID=1168545 RepID=A0A6G1J208_9PLEO|nr:hypothetical protein K458DRAFT_38460 [Lentithecium fluviatile CBS 122367]
MCLSVCLLIEPAYRPRSTPPASDSQRVIAEQQTSSTHPPTHPPKHDTFHGILLTPSLSRVACRYKLLVNPVQRSIKGGSNERGFARSLAHSYVLGSHTPNQRSDVVRGGNMHWIGVRCVRVNAECRMCMHADRAYDVLCFPSWGTWSWLGWRLVGALRGKERCGADGEGLGFIGRVYGMVCACAAWGTSCMYIEGGLKT